MLDFSYCETEVLNQNRNVNFTTNSKQEENKNIIIKINEN